MCGGTARVLVCRSAQATLHGSRLRRWGRGSVGQSPLIPDRDRRQRGVTVFVHAVNRCADVQSMTLGTPVAYLAPKAVTTAIAAVTVKLSRSIGIVVHTRGIGRGLTVPPNLTGFAPENGTRTSTTTG